MHRQATLLRRSRAAAATAAAQDRTGKLRCVDITSHSVVAHQIQPPYSGGVIDVAELVCDRLWLARVEVAYHLMQRQLGADSMQRCLGAMFGDANWRATQRKLATARGASEEAAYEMPPKRCWSTLALLELFKRLTGHDLRPLVRIGAWCW